MIPIIDDCMNLYNYNANVEIYKHMEIYMYTNAQEFFTKSSQHKNTNIANFVLAVQFEIK